MSVNNNFLSLTSRNYAYKAYITEEDLNTQEVESTQQSAVLSSVDTTQDTLSPSNVIATISGERLEANFASIKAAIYNFCHPNTSGISSSYGTTFDQICTQLNLGPGKTITKKSLTQFVLSNEDKEDSNNSLIGSLNRAFSSLGANDTISYNDLMLFFMRGNSNADNTMTLSEYSSAVNIYADKTEGDYQNCSTDQQKLEFIISKTEQYLDEAGMTLQKAALTRLLAATSDNNSAKGNQTASKGQIAFGDLGGAAADGSITLGAYQPTLAYGGISTNTRNGKDYNVTVWMGDFDNDWIDINDNGITDADDWQDGGITLNRTYFMGYNKPWYQLVETLVHELTHATAFYYYDVSYNTSGRDVTNLAYSQKGIDFMVSKGLTTAGAYDRTDYDDTELAQLVSTMWGEYAAYITSCNYMDSIGGDAFSSSDLCVSKSNERQAIYDHIDDFGYNSPNYEPEPLYTDLTTWDKYYNMFYNA